MTHAETHAAVEGAFAAIGEPARRERMEQRRLEMTARFVDDVADGWGGKRVLELGSSFGLNLVTAKRLGAASAVGVDYFVFPDVQENDFTVSQGQFAAVEASWKREGVETIRHDLANPLPFADGSFDLVISNAVIEHLHGIHRQVFQEAYRVLAPDGRFVFTTPNVASLLKRIRFAVGRSPLWDINDYFDQGTNFTGHVREFTPEECDAMLTRAGFTKTVVVARPGYFKWRWLAMPKKWHMFAIQSISMLSDRFGDLIFACGTKR